MASGLSCDFGVRTIIVGIGNLHRWKYRRISNVVFYEVGHACATEVVP